MPDSLNILESAKEKMLRGEFSSASNYYQRAITEGIPPEIVELRYLTKNYLVYPIEYEDSCEYFNLLELLQFFTEQNPEYVPEYRLALQSLLDLKQLFSRAISLFYFSDIEVCSRDSVVVTQIAQLLNYIRTNKNDIIGKDWYSIKKYIPYADFQKFARDLNIIEVYCINLLLTYTAEQERAYLGKKYSALTIDYGYFAITDIYSSDRYVNWAVLKPRLHMIGGEAYYDDLLRDYQDKLQVLKNFNSPKELQQELTVLINHKYEKTGTNIDFYEYAKHFEKKDASRFSIWGSMVKISNIINPLNRLNPMTHLLDKKKVCSFELDNYFPRKKIWGVCDMISAGQGVSIDTVRCLMIIAGCFAGLGVLAYAALAVGMRFGFYWGVRIEQH